MIFSMLARRFPTSKLGLSFKALGKSPSFEEKYGFEAYHYTILGAMAGSVMGATTLTMNNSYKYDIHDRMLGSFFGGVGGAICGMIYPVAYVAFLGTGISYIVDNLPSNNKSCQNCEKKKSNY